MVKQLFILGTGFIGGSVLAALLDKKDQYEIAALNRDDAKVAKLEALGVRPVKGSLDSHDVISKEAAKADTILHIATADDLPSVKSILKGLAQRDASKEPAVYIHTSGTGVLTVPDHPDDIVFNDKSPEKFDTLIPDHAPHREIDLVIKEAVESNKLNAKISIILPPTIYGVGSGPFNQISIQVPGWIKRTVKDGKLTLWGPHRRWQNIHIKNLVTGYLTLLSHLESPSTTSPPLYIIAETGEHYWRAVGERLDVELKKRGILPADSKPTEVHDGNTEVEVGTQSRSKSEHLHDWGWKVDSSLPSVFDEIPNEIDHLKELKQI